MLINRHNTLPAGGLTPHGSSIGSRCTMHSNPEDFDVCSFAEHISGSHRSGSGGSGVHHAPLEGDETSALRAAASADITNSMTVSSITSYITESSTAQKSPTATEVVRAVASSPPSPRVSAAQDGSVAVRITASPLRTSPSSSSAFMPIKPSAHRSQSQQSYPQGGGGGAPPVTYPEGYTPGVPALLTSSGQATSHRSNASPVPRLSPFNSYIPQAGLPPTLTSHAGGHHLAMGGHTMPANASTPALYPATPTTHYVSGSTGSIQPQADPSHEILLQEITRLRERVHTLESENTTMNLKLNQQQYDVENRLTEIEMHFCGEDSVTSGESETLKNLQGNNESVIWDTPSELRRASSLGTTWPMIASRAKRHRHFRSSVVLPNREREHGVLAPQPGPWVSTTWW